MKVQILRDRQGVEYKLIKANRVNLVVERLSDGRRMKGNTAIFDHVRLEEDTAPLVDPRIRPGALVKLLPNTPILMNSKHEYDEDTIFVVLGYGIAPREFRIIEVGGNERNTYFKSVPADEMTAEV